MSLITFCILDIFISWNHAVIIINHITFVIVLESTQRSPFISCSSKCQEVRHKDTPKLGMDLSTSLALLKILPFNKTEIMII